MSAAAVAGVTLASGVGVGWLAMLAAMIRNTLFPAARPSASPAAFNSADLERIMKTITEAAGAISDAATALNTSAQSLTAASDAIKAASDTSALDQPLADLVTASQAVSTATAAIQAAAGINPGAA